MEENKREAFQNLQNNIKELILEFQDQQDKRLGDLSKLNTKTLIAMEQALRFWCTDALVRLIRLPDSKNLDVWKVYDWAEGVAAGLNVDQITQCYLQTRDERTLIALIIFRIDLVTIQK